MLLEGHTAKKGMAAVRFSPNVNLGPGSAGENTAGRAASNCMTGNDSLLGGGRTARPADRGTMPRRRRPGVLRDSALALAVAVACATGTVAAATAAPARAAGHLAHLTRASSSGLAAGQTGTRSEVPWTKVGPGWALADYTTGDGKNAGPVALYLVDPQGGKYKVYQWPATTAPLRLIAWSGDKTRALLTPVTRGGIRLEQLDLITGKLTSFKLPASVGSVFGYTNPEGDNILVQQDGIARYNLAGKFQMRLIKGLQFNQAISAANGQSEVVDAPAGLDVVSNTGGVISRIRVPAVNKSGGCIPARWWSATVVLARCGVNGTINGTRLWLVPVSGAAPTALTAVRDGKGIDLADMDGWKFRSGLYVQAIGACGNQFIGKQAANGTVSVVNPPHSDGTNIVTATAGSKMLVREVFEGCFPNDALVWFDPATGSVTKVLPAPKGGWGVLDVVAYNRNGEEPSGVE